MANKRQLKKAIGQMCAELFVESVAISHNQNLTSQEDLDNVMASILLLQDDMICRVSHPEPGMKPARYYKQLRNDMVQRTEELVDQLSALI